MVSKELLRETAKAKLYMVIIIGLGLGMGALAILQAGFLSRIINGVFLQGQLLSALWELLAWLLGVMLLRVVCSFVSELTAYRLAAEIKHDLRQRLFAQLIALGPHYLRDERTGELVNLLTEGIEALEVYFARYLPQLALAALVPCTVLAWILPIDLLSAFILLCTAPLIPLFMWLIGCWADAAAKRQWKILSRMSAHFLDVLQGLSTLKIFGRSREQAVTIGRISEIFKDTTLSVLRVAFLSALALELLTTLSTAIVAVTVGLRLVYATISFEQALFLLLLAPEFYLPLRLLGSHFHAGLAGSNAAKRIFEVMSQPLPQNPAATVRLEDSAGLELTFQNVFYAYEEGERPALTGTSFTIRAGEQVALAGPSGAGKSTVADLILGFMRPDKGEIVVNGISLAEIPLEQWRQLIAYVPQQTYLFHGSVAENIAMGNPKAMREDIVAAARQAGADAFIAQLPQGYDTLLGDGGRQLSGGQTQLVALARAFLKNAPLVILDEPTTGLDLESERLLAKALDHLLANRTALIIAHRLGTIRGAERIIVLEQGQVSEEGQHHVLMARHGIYRQMVAAAGGI